MSSLPYTTNEDRPPVIKEGPRVPDAVNEFGERVRGDTTRYLLVPDIDFKRPYLAVPGVNEAFVWPLPVEGFDISLDTQLAVHRYLGEVNLDVSITHQDERHIELSGKFPGHTSRQNMDALTRIYIMETPASGKILSLPGVLSSQILVIGERLRYSHGEGDFSSDIMYSISFVRVGSPASQSSLTTQNFVTAMSTAAVAGPQRGRGTSVFIVTVSLNTLRRIAQHLFRDAGLWVDLYKFNGDYFDNLNTPTHLIPNHPLPVGLKPYY